jgi:hypothetical protein
MTTTATATRTSRFATVARRLSGLAIAGSIVTGTIAVSAAPASARTVVTIKGCAVNNAGHAETGALMKAWFYGSAGWTQYRTTTKTASNGCGSIVVPSGYYWALEVIHTPAQGYPSVLSMCQVKGFYAYDDGYSDTWSFPLGSSGSYNLGTFYAATHFVSCT